MSGFTKREFKDALVDECYGCAVQHTGWPCATCFFHLSDDITNADWQTVLHYRGDYKVKDLPNLPKPQQRKETLEKIWEICLDSL